MPLPYATINTQTYGCLGPRCRAKVLADASQTSRRRPCLLMHCGTPQLSTTEIEPDHVAATVLLVAALGRRCSGEGSCNLHGVSSAAVEVDCAR